jgi:hypothetical protein
VSEAAPLSWLWALTAGPAPSVDAVLERWRSAKIPFDAAPGQGAEREVTVHFQQKPAGAAYGDVVSRHAVIRCGAPPDLDALRPGVFGMWSFSQPQGAVGLGLRCEDVPALELHAQLKLLLLAEPQLSVFFDESANALRTCDWVRSIAEARTPPSPVALFTVRMATGLVRTRGLRRFGHPDFQLEGVKPEHVPRACTLLSAWCELFLDGEGVNSGRPLAMAPNLKATWLLREEGLGAIVPAGATRDLFAGPEPTLWLRSKAEGARAALLAHERLPHLLRLFSAHARSPEWSFWAKAAVTDPAADSSELLWFELLALDEARWRGRLWSPPLTQGPKPGDELDFGVDALADWRVEGAEGTFGPDTVLELMPR